MIEKNRNNATIQFVTLGSIAEEAGIEKGDKLLSINENEILDVFDYRFYISEEELLLEIEKPDGEIWEIEIEKEQYEDLGIDFETSMLDDCKSCTNDCVFCFIDQLPKGMRDTLYFKDDDSRLSFLTGNYVTLTNMKDEDIERIIKYKMSPINISVHTTNPELRIKMLNNRFAGNILDRIQKLVNAGITVNCQVVACRGINDGVELERTLLDLGEFFPGMSSISVVPVGITRHRDGLEKLLPYDKDSSTELIQLVEKWQSHYLKNKYKRVVYLADEFYIMAEKQIPDYEHYEDFPQIENGVGLISMLQYEVNEYLEYLKDMRLSVTPRNISIATGVSAFKFIKQMTNDIEELYPQIKIQVFEIINKFFGENVTVTGLLTGIDIVSQLKNKELGEELLICKSMLKADEDIFLDDYKLEDIRDILKIKVSPVENSGKAFVESIIGIET